VASIVVGVDASEHARRAVTWALAEARIRAADVELCHAIDEAELPVWPAPAAVPSRHELETAGWALLDRLLSDVDTAGVAVTTRIGWGSAARALCAAGRDADLLVVGARGMGGFRGLLVGSVSQQVVAHASCPVVIVVPERA
jgi:nucleotide-binding universal stress UspA family protein